MRAAQKNIMLLQADRQTINQTGKQASKQGGTAQLSLSMEDADFRVAQTPRQQSKGSLIYFVVCSSLKNAQGNDAPICRGYTYITVVGVCKKENRDDLRLDGNRWREMVSMRRVEGVVGLSFGRSRDGAGRDFRIGDLNVEL
jgi:hypothetical protein